ncbi:dihydrofolate reductase [Lacinutrix sp. 5H-3-7-4]|uniref:dihydrofolate reductase n=1 Tax=Lacinutrix sp. (strain 5H-3-7-4) TaxID=983544 RepID=UPI00020A3539|nr:dihydrofolate reductase [Lacinutrix sp. 5H-3-7-4]AEH01332.1 dihydrofolate reductase region [Lacinutrix sp. 5H-3-7-4]
MFKKKKQQPQIDPDQLALIENAQRRVKQKKHLYAHFVIFLIGAVFLIIANVGLGIGEEFQKFDLPWFVFAILIWLFFFLYHLFNVFITHKFMGKDWEKAQIEKLVAKQKAKIEKLEANLPKSKTDSNLKSSSTTQIPHKNLTMIVAAGENNEIGKDNDLIWHLKDDLKRFKSLTSGHHIIMGRKTFESFPKPLPNRTHVVISRQKDYQVPVGVLVVHSLEDAIDAAKGDTQPFIIGGGEIYRQAMPLAAKIEITRVHSTFNADTFFPEIDTTVWKETNSVVHPQDEDHKYAFSFITYERK